MDFGPLSPEDEQFLYETFMKLTSREFSDRLERTCSEDDSEESIDIPLVDFFDYDEEPEGYTSPIECTLSTVPKQPVFNEMYPSSPSPCESPVSLFPPIHLDTLFTEESPLVASEIIPSPTSMQIPQQPQELPQLKEEVNPIAPNELTPPSSTQAESSLVQSTQAESSLVQSTQAESALVQFIDLKNLYEKAQVRRKGTSEQRLVDCRIHMISNFQVEPCNVQVWVQRFAEIKGFQNYVQLPVIVEKTLPTMQCFSVNLDAVYLTSLGNRFYQLSTTDRQRKNRFILHAYLIFPDNSIAQFDSEPFLIRSRKISPNPRKPRTASSHPL
ncbi:uncharacterized protein LOC124433473 [Xenia sp. Carnegie-2017]|uniref:uncharacterized protein LOC124433473 n=1 Tax=Xenia sp. Carnegie-2017 TaxID=2897299 RepID=UPI001F038C69|nr:uncharacterized protein LOC124433473 [Xenia sp. Carnegie-2017]XP_046839206.1 uncharacterized protein LOC124433473 [Xenia sp. Carnegie-2017]